MLKIELLCLVFGRMFLRFVFLNSVERLHKRRSRFLAAMDDYAFVLGCFISIQLRIFES